MSFVHLQVQSSYSLLQSACKIDELINAAVKEGHPALAIADENVMYGVIPFYHACQKAGIKPIVGVKLSILMDEQQSYPLILLAKDLTGYQNLLKLTSIIGTKSPQGIPKKWLSAYSSGVIAITPGLEGEIENLLLNGEIERATLHLKEYQTIFNHFYVSIQDHGLPENRALYPLIKQLQKETNIKLVITNDVRYIEKDDALIQDALFSVKNGTKLSDESRPRLYSSEYYYKTKTELLSLFADEEESFQNTLHIADLCDLTIPFHQPLLPKYPVPEEYSTVEYLKIVCEKGLIERYGEMNDELKHRLEFELNTINKMGFNDYFLIVWDFIKYAHEQGIAVGPGRGSAAGSLVAYVLKITNVDPIHYNLLFERFLNEERITMPDIDIDFPDHRRDEMIDYVASKYGEVHVAQIITFGTLGAKAAIRDIARVMGLAPSEIDRYSKLIPSTLGISLKDVYEQSKAFNSHVEHSGIHKRIFEVACRVEGLPRHTSIHAAGVIISELPLTNVVPLQEGNHGVFLTQYPAEILEELGLVKMDFLGLRNLSLLEEVCRLIYETKGELIKLEEIPLEDQKTFEILSKGDTSGVFQLESSGMRRVLQQLQPNQFEDIVAVNALYRPGPMEQIPKFIQYKHGLEKVTYPHPVLEKILEPTYGVIVYQEQIMQIASTLSGFTLSEADLLRRAVSKKKKEVLDEERIHFVEGAISKGYDEQVANEVYDLIVQFANYGFNRSHAVAYSMIAYQLAYLKANFPLQFYAALLSSFIGSEEKVSNYIGEAKLKGIPIYPPSINKSQYAFVVEGNGIRFSLLAIKNIGMATVREILQKRPYKDFFDVCIKISPKALNRKSIENLIFAGCFDEFNLDRATLLANIDIIFDYVDIVRPENEDQFDLFLDEDFVPKPEIIRVDPMKISIKLELEKQALGTYLTGHPISQYEKLHIESGTSTISSILMKKDTEHLLFVYIKDLRITKTKKQQHMAFLQVEDLSTSIDAVVFPTTFEKYRHKLKEKEVVVVKAKIDERDERKQLIINEVLTIEEMEERNEQKEYTLFIKITGHTNKNISYTIQQTIAKYKGHTKVVLYYDEEKKAVQLSEQYYVNPSVGCLSALKNIVGDGNVVLKK
ncbi:DNA polymerase III subunit alpha [Bacillus sp. AFS017336]|uniref:DNA polymerase III subunit alpha n=1 Tax=Bacillus sp. AFS017336 TaxID=2033489 RepID=UPI000BF21569|nr:DNA polymerase III subunit alpha [Bacillus sp. AFS017336]PEL12559.1 DNA polymerase III subunit alpha [Bacillus sp. AFS017336]